MPSIQSSPNSLVFRAGNLAAIAPPATAAGAIAVRTVTRALEGMQKEALVSYGQGGTVWRMVCDEGPYLDGTDLAPFPLAFFTAGMAFSYLSEILALARERGIILREFAFVQTNRYGMEGSALKGTMTGSAMPVELEVFADTDATEQQLNDLVCSAVAASPAGGLLREILVSRFTLTANGTSVAPDRVEAYVGAVADDPAAVFDGARPEAGDEPRRDIIEKIESAKTVFGVEGGASSSLAAEQKRELQVRGVCRLRPDGLKEIQVQLVKPIGSVFRFLSDDSAALGGAGRAPPGLAYLSAGIAFCYMTQLGRYAHIMKKPMEGYRIVQDTGFSLPGASGRTGSAGKAEPVVTHVFVDSPHGTDYARRLVDMGEQTCFLHAACRGVVKAKVRTRVCPDIGGALQGAA